MKSRKEAKVFRSQSKRGSDRFGSERCKMQILYLVKICESEGMRHKFLMYLIMKCLISDIPSYLNKLYCNFSG